MEKVAETEKKLDGMPDKELTIEIISADDDETFTFERNAKIKEVINTAVTKFGLEPKDAYDLTFSDRPKEPLEHERPLGSYHEIHDGTKLVLTSRGGGV